MIFSNGLGTKNIVRIMYLGFKIQLSLISYSTSYPPSHWLSYLPPSATPSIKLSLLPTQSQTDNLTTSNSSRLLQIRAYDQDSRKLYELRLGQEGPFPLECMQVTSLMEGSDTLHLRMATVLAFSYPYLAPIMFSSHFMYRNDSVFIEETFEGLRYSGNSRVSS